MKVKIILLLVLALAVLGLAACKPDVSPAGEAPAEALSPESVVRNFYDWYLSDRELGPKDPRNPGFLTQAFIAEIDAAYERADPGGPGINFVAAQDFPEWVEVGEASIEGSLANVPVTTSFGGQLQLSLEQVDGEWKISGVQSRQP